MLEQLRRVIIRSVVSSRMIISIRVVHIIRITTLIRSRLGVLGIIAIPLSDILVVRSSLIVLTMLVGRIEIIMIMILKELIVLLVLIPGRLLGRAWRRIGEGLEIY